jgi:type II secretory pathway pseudopilin PulG
LPIANRKSSFTLIEMLTTVAALVIVLGLMVSLARYERRRSAEAFTRDNLLAKLDALLASDEVQSNKALQEGLANIPHLVRSSGREPEEPVLQFNARRNNEDFVKLFKKQFGPKAFNKIPLSLYNPTTDSIVDAWGTPIVYMPAGALNVGISPQNRSFFLSAGPDRRFSSVVDNLYSYERGWDQPPAAGQRE